MDTSLEALKWLIGLEPSTFPETIVKNLSSKNTKLKQSALDILLFIATDKSLYQIMALAINLGAGNYVIKLSKSGLSMNSTLTTGFNFNSNIANDFIFSGIDPSAIGIAAFRDDLEALKLLTSSRKCTTGFFGKELLLKRLTPLENRPLTFKRSESFKLVLRMEPILTQSEVQEVFVHTLQMQQPNLANMLFNEKAFGLSLIDNISKEHHIFKVRSNPLLRWFTDKGNFLNQRNKKGQTLLLLAIREKVDLQLFRTIASLSSKEIDTQFDTKFPEGYPRFLHLALDLQRRGALHYACEMDNFEQVKFLFKLPYVKKCQINLQDKDGWTPLAIAVSNGNFDIVAFLLKKGADPRTKLKHYGLSIVDLAAFLHRGETLRESQNMKLRTIDRLRISKLFKNLT